MAETECQRFFALSKRVPKDVKRYCGICRQHGVLLETRGHSCNFKDCACNKCQLVRTRRQIMSQQIRLRRAQDKRFQRTNEPTKADVIPMKMTNGNQQDETASNSSTDPSSSLAKPTIAMASTTDELLTDAKNMCYFCQKCKNHEILVWKKQHKRQCPFTDCTCDKCELIETRRRLDQHMKKRKASQMSGGATDGADSPASSLNDCSVSPKTLVDKAAATADEPQQHSPAKQMIFSASSPHQQNDTMKIEDAFLIQRPLFPMFSTASVRASEQIHYKASPATSPIFTTTSVPQIVDAMQFSSPTSHYVSKIPSPQIAATFASSLSGAAMPSPSSAPLALLAAGGGDFFNVLARLNATSHHQTQLFNQLQQQAGDIFQLVSAAKTISPPICASSVSSSISEPASLASSPIGCVVGGPMFEASPQAQQFFDAQLLSSLFNGGNGQGNFGMSVATTARNLATSTVSTMPSSFRELEQLLIAQRQMQQIQ